MLRAYPERPVVGVGAVILIEGRVVLVRRAHPPMEGQWTLPGGTVELGETLEAALVREMREETGIDVEVGPVIEVFDRIERDPHERIRFHHVIVDYSCRAIGGVLRAADDADEVALADPTDLSGWNLTAIAQRVIARAVDISWGPESPHREQASPAPGDVRRAERGKADKGAGEAERCR